MKRLVNPCDCPLMHIWCDGQPFRVPPVTVGAKTTYLPRYEGYATVVLDDGNPDLSGDGRLWAYRFIGDKTSNECEYTAVIIALEWTRAGSAKTHVITDSGLVVNQVLGDWWCRPRLQVPRDRVRELLKETGATLSWQGRDYNKAGWYNANVLERRRKEKVSHGL